MIYSHLSSGGIVAQCEPLKTLKIIAQQIDRKNVIIIRVSYYSKT